MCVLCVRDINTQQCRHVPEHTHIHILMQRLMYVEVWNIMVLQPNVPDLNKNEQTPDVVKERPCRGSDSWEHIIERRARHTLSHTHGHRHTHAYVHANRHMAFVHAYAHIHAHAHAQAHTHADTHVHTHTKTNSHAHTRTHTDTHMPRVHTQTRTRIHT